MASILLCDDEPVVCRSLARLLRLQHQVVTADGPGGLERLQQERFDVVVTDLRMPGVNGFEIIDAVRRLSPATPVIAMSGSAETSDAVRAMRSGARDFLIKPVDAGALEEAFALVLGPSTLRPEEPSAAQDPFAWRDRYAPWLLGKDPALLPFLNTLSRVADANCTVFITGEPGTGKELVARAIVAGSSRASAPFVKVNCAAFSPTLVESELFGHVKGAFTGAVAGRVGRFAQAHKGTIFLDEIGEMELGVQAKLLRLIQEGELCPVGSDATQKIDVRVLAATNRKMESEVAAGRFRADLYWRLNVIPVNLPSLRQRVSDVPLLVEHFICGVNERNRRAVTGVAPDAMGALMRHPWLGNVRELEHLVERLVTLKGTGQIGLADLPPELVSARPSMPASTPLPDLPDAGVDLRAILEQVEDGMIAEALERTNGNKGRAAELLGLNRTTLVEKLRRKRNPSST